MPTNDLLEALPDLILVLRRDCSVLRSYGGRGVPGLLPAVDPVGKRLEAAWPASVTGLIKQLTREAITRATTTEASFQHAERSYGMRISALDSEHAVCIIRGVLDGAQDGAPEAQESFRPKLHRRGLLRRLNDSISVATLRGTPAAVAVIHIDGMTDIKQIVSAEICEQIMSEAVLRLAPSYDDSARAGPWVYLGQFSDSMLLLVLATAERDAIDTCISQICNRLRQPVNVGDALFQLTPYAGVAILGQDASAPKTLLDRARSAATAARRAGSPRARFVGDDSALRSARPDIARELGKAIANAEIRLRYVGRHDLATGRLVAWVGHLHWQHRVYGEIHPLELVRLAEITGRGTDLARAALKRLQEDFIAFAPRLDAGVRISFGAPRQHILHEDFIGDIERLLAEAVVPAERLELRISVKAAVSRAPADFDSLAQRGIQMVVDDMGRGMDLPLDWLARVPIRGLQLNRGWVGAIRTDAEALKLCRAGIGLATTLGLIPIATAVDEPAQRDALLALGCQQGSGELYRGELIPSDIIEDPRAVVAA
jgi:EAL domain-containing protein (putative c-di-GMP-specific phosphodiesterase class I)/GGDEF domain-containing protein